jgi:hypothetical protein
LGSLLRSDHLAINEPLRHNLAAIDGAAKSGQLEGSSKLLEVKDTALATGRHLDLVILGEVDLEGVLFALSVAVVALILGDVIAEAVVKIGIIRASLAVTVCVCLAIALQHTLVLLVDELLSGALWRHDRAAIQVLSRGLSRLKDDGRFVAGLADAGIGALLPCPELTDATARRPVFASRRAPTAQDANTRALPILGRAFGTRTAIVDARAFPANSVGTDRALLDCI